jgi:hypothetical protein
MQGCSLKHQLLRLGIGVQKENLEAFDTFWQTIFLLGYPHFPFQQQVWGYAIALHPQQNSGSPNNHRPKNDLMFLNFYFIFKYYYDYYLWYCLLGRCSTTWAIPPALKFLFLAKQ